MHAVPAALQAAAVPLDTHVEQTAASAGSQASLPLSVPLLAMYVHLPAPAQSASKFRVPDRQKTNSVTVFVCEMEAN